MSEEDRDEAFEQAKNDSYDLSTVVWNAIEEHPSVDAHSVIGWKDRHFPDS